jgi:YHS domain-containing protein
MNPHFKRLERASARLVLAVAASCLLIPCRLAAGDEPPSIDWRDDYSSALEDARTANRLLWIQFTGAWCPNCTRMERDSLTSAAIVEHSKRSFLPLKLRADANEALAAAFNLTAIPATIIVAPNRDVIVSRQGYLGPEELDDLLRDCLARTALKPAEDRGADTTDETGTKPPGRQEFCGPPVEAVLALRGYCPVSLVESRKLVKGVMQHSTVHRGRTYRFSSHEAGERFRLQPSVYAPWSGGCCPVTLLEQGLTRAGDPRWGVLYDGHLFVCASEADRQRFFANPAPYAAQQVDLPMLSSAESPAPEHQLPR